LKGVGLKKDMESLLQIKSSSV